MRLRVDDRLITGTVLAARDSLVIRTDTGVTRTHLDQVTGLRRSLGPRSRRGGATIGIGYGLLLGAGGGLMIGMATHDPEPSGGSSLFGGLGWLGTIERGLNGLLLGGGAGALVGGAIGAMRPGERWEKPVTARVGLSPAGSRGAMLRVEISTSH